MIGADFRTDNSALGSGELEPESASRFWPFRRIEGGWLLALSLLLIAAAIWLVRRRAA